MIRALLTLAACAVTASLSGRFLMAILSHGLADLDDRDPAEVRDELRFAALHGIDRTSQMLTGTDWPRADDSNGTRAQPDFDQELGARIRRTLEAVPAV